MLPESFVAFDSIRHKVQNTSTDVQIGAHVRDQLFTIVRIHPQARVHFLEADSVQEPTQAISLGSMPLPDIKRDEPPSLVPFLLFLFLQPVFQNQPLGIHFTFFGQLQ